MSIKVYLKPKNKLERIDFTKLRIVRDYHGEDEISLTTPFYAHTSHEIAVDVRVVSDLFESFGGIVRGRETSTSDKLYNYTGFDYSSTLRGTFWKNFKNKTTKAIVQAIAKESKIKTTSLFNASKKHKNLFFKGDTSRMNAIRQVCALDNEQLRPYVTHNKKVGLKYVKDENSGFVIHVGDYISADESLDLNDLINHIIIYTKKGKVKKTYKNKNSIVEFGDLTKILHYPENPKKDSSDVQDLNDQAKKEWYEKSKTNYKTVVRLPLKKEYVKLEVGYKLVFKYDGKSAMNNKMYWIQKLEIYVDGKDRYLELTLFDRKPYLFDDWRYKDPDGKNVDRTQKAYQSSTKTTTNTITSPTVVNKASACNFCTKSLTTAKVMYENKCPACGVLKKLTYSSNIFTCSNCKVRYCAKCGSEIRKPIRYTLKRASTVNSKPSNVNNDVYNKALALWKHGGLEIAYFVASMEYIFYGGSRSTVNQTFKNKEGNCVDLSQLVIAMYACVGITGNLTYTTVVMNGKKYDHANVKIKINSVTYIIDPSCDGVKYKPANMNEGKFIGR